jgi:hypothetical protein
MHSQSHSTRNYLTLPLLGFFPGIGRSKKQMPYPIQNQHHTHYHPSQLQYRHFVALRRHAAQARRAAF